MSKFFALEMSHEVSKHPKLNVSKGFLGFCRKVTYIPTDSQVESYSNYYAKQDAERIRDLINCSDDKAQSQVDAFQPIETQPGSSFRLDLCVSDDAQFIAMQLNHVANGVMTHITPIRYFEGALAKQVENIF